MRVRIVRFLLALGSVLVWLTAGPLLGSECQDAAPPGNVALLNGQWFDGREFVPRPAYYSVNGTLTATRPPRIDRNIDLSGGYVVPPFAEAHNHNIGSGNAERDRQAIRRYLTDGVFYVKIQGNLPLTAAARAALGVNRPSSVDAVFAQGSLTATDGHPIGLIEQVLLPGGSFPGYTIDTLRDFRFFTIDSAAELDSKWPRVLQLGPDFIKVMLLFSEEFEQRRSDPAYFGQKGIDPTLLPAIVRRAHSAGLHVSAHVATGADFGVAVAAGVDEIAHLPPVTPIDVADARRAAARGVVVDTTCFTAVPTLIRMGVVREADVRRVEAVNLGVLLDGGVRLAIGSDNPMDTSAGEVAYLRGLGVFDNLGLLRLWTETSRTIFPERRVGALQEGFEASFLVLEGNPLEDFDNVGRLRLRFKDGAVLEP